MKQLRRSQTNRKIMGVCGGIGEYFNIDPTIIRIAWLFFALAYGSGLVAYLIVGLIMPDE